MLLVVQGVQWLGAHQAFPRKPLLYNFMVYWPLWICYVLYTHTPVCTHTHTWLYITCEILHIIYV